MKKIIQVLLIVMITISSKVVYAICDYNQQAQLNSIASKVKVSYEIQADKEMVECEDGSPCEITTDRFRIMILNLDENVYVEVKNDIDDEVKRFDYSSLNDDKIAYFDWNNSRDITNFTFTVYSSDKTFCSDEKLAIKYLTTPRRNFFAGYEQCTKMPDFEYCQDFVTFKEIKYDEFNQKFNQKAKEVEKEEVEKNKSFWQKIKDFFNNNKIIVIICLGVIVVGVIVYIFLKRKAKKLWQS